MILAAVAYALTTPAHAGDWPRWRGPNYNGISNETDIKTDFGRSGPPVLWKASIGQGYSSSVIADGRLYILGLKGKTEVLSCLNTVSGDEIWTHSYSTNFKAQFYDGGTSGTPTIIDGKVYLLNQTGTAFCLDAATGDVIWETDIKKKLGLEVGVWGFTGAPFEFGDSIIVNAGKNGVALSKKNGNVVWSSGKDANGYATPVPYKSGNKEMIAVFGAKALYGVDPKNGRVSWNKPWKTSYDVNAADPVFLDDQHILISSGYGTGAALIKVNGNSTSEVWKNKNLRTQFNAAVLHQGYLYGIDGNTSDRATLNCIEAKTGKLVWKERNIGTGGLTLANGHLFVITERGQLHIAEASPKGYKPKVRKQIYGGKTWTVPTLANGILYCRNSKGDLVALNLK